MYYIDSKALVRSKLRREPEWRAVFCATQANVRLANEEGSLILEVHDNGKGISKEELSAGTSLGILGMRERALPLGGRLAISGAPDGMTPGSTLIRGDKNNLAPASVLQAL